MRHGLLGAVAVPLILLARCAPDGCSPTTPPLGDGTFVVGTDVRPGVYRSTSPEMCFWRRVGPAGEADIVAQALINGPSQQIVEIEATDAAFRTTACNGWTPAAPRPMVTRLGQGDWAVGVDIAPGRWQSGTTLQGCTWERASGFTHEPPEVIAAETVHGRALVEITPTDVRFTTGPDCGTWTRIGD